MAAATGCFKRILDVLDKWPVDKARTGRDLGEFLRKNVNKAYMTNQFEANIKYWDKQYLFIQKLVNNEVANKYPRLISSSATGLTREQCEIALSNDFLEELKKEDEGYFKGLYYRIKDKLRKN
ncbi:hypothetical protein WA026_004813 [Henosepilachna vigintioctopunctata]|uniref:Mitochondrial nucleoid factor 1 n=1 Tax=Henosepilachna vigintioctopunctata TaxID=420089 RepID=A0AAW1URR0_9CUCU